MCCSDTPNSTQIHGNDMSNTACLQARQPDPHQPGRTDPIVNGMAQLKSSDNNCPVCNATMPCLYDILAVRSPVHNTNTTLSSTVNPSKMLH